jgi:hypothetical protein
LGSKSGIFEISSRPLSKIYNKTLINYLKNHYLLRVGVIHEGVFIQSLEQLNSEQGTFVVLEEVLHFVRVVDLHLLRDERSDKLIEAEVTLLH